ncbi:hypothetical protein LTR64_003287 [Lithohypha guttulata]|uniref:uncharacterized protein n=1 Tax=Lithohypha guttulata TaxID=1690604 RepID=UPI002DE18461|nr:hypothetical protein LTR51_000493 [Lithohypha guttulata]
MFSMLTRSIKRQFSSNNNASDRRTTRTTTLPKNHPKTSSGRKRILSQYRERDRQHLPQDADNDDTEEEDDSEEEEELVDEDGGSSAHDREEAPLLPIFSSADLDVLPVFTMTHLFREMVVERCDTVLTWEQLRSPQVSQFLVKPIQQEIRQNHMNSATQYALMANALQFNKEAGILPGNSGTNKTRAMLCELIAIRLVRECTTHELIDALSYDFDPLQGQPSTEPMLPAGGRRYAAPRPARISCIEVAIRASAKRYLSHPLVIQHLQAIWNGTIVFHSLADSMHRKRSLAPQQLYGTHSSTLLAVPSSTSNRTATLYNPREASLFKLSRLRVPRYRNILNTFSFAILLILFITVLEDKSLDITTLELVFWAWTAGYMLDEVIGFNEQGFSLYMASFWNTFDLGILVLLFVHLCLRLYGVVLPDDNENKHYIAKLSYDVLAASAVLLFPRLFSVLDHYRYFSQLIIAFRMMAADMVAIFLLIIVFCSGFLVALTFAFSRGPQTDTPKDVAYALLQMLLGFTPAAWDRWTDYNILGKMVLVLFLFVCHFVVVTILITVMTNSFMEIVRNSNEEHHNLFAINVISNVKSDSLFAYIPPLNVLQWLVTPLRYILPFRQYLKVNRTIIKVTHLPILWTIYLYERFLLRARYVDSIDLVENKGRVRRTFSERLPRLMREPSIATFRQEAALEEVFRQATFRSTRSREQHKSTNTVDNWINTMDDEDAEPPQEQDRKVVDKLERRHLGSRRLNTYHIRDFSLSKRPTSVASDPNDLTSHADLMSSHAFLLPAADMTPSGLDLPAQQTDADGDDELMTNEHEEDNDTNVAPSDLHTGSFIKLIPRDNFATPAASIQSPYLVGSTTSAGSRQGGVQFLRPPGRRNRPQHMRNVSSATMIYNPPAGSESDERVGGNTINESPKRKSPKAIAARSQSPSLKPSSGQGRRSPRRGLPVSIERTSLPPRNSAAFRSVPDMANLHALPHDRADRRASPGRPRRSSLEVDLVSDIGDNKAIGGGYVGAIPSSFASQMAHATNAMRRSQHQLREDEEKRRHDNNELFGRLMMARMNSLEEGFRDVVHEVRESMRQVGSGLASRQRSPDRDNAAQIQAQKRPNKRFKERQETSTRSSDNVSAFSGGHRNNQVETAEKSDSKLAGDAASNGRDEAADEPSTVQVTIDSPASTIREERKPDTETRTHPDNSKE